MLCYFPDVKLCVWSATQLDPQLALFQGSFGLGKRNKKCPLQTFWVPPVTPTGSPTAPFHHGVIRKFLTLIQLNIVLKNRDTFVNHCISEWSCCVGGAYFV